MQSNRDYQSWKETDTAIGLSRFVSDGKLRELFDSRTLEELHKLLLQYEDRQRNLERRLGTKSPILFYD